MDKPYSIVDRRGIPYVQRDAGPSIPNMDRGFWMPFGVGNPGISLSQVMSRPYQNHAWSYACGRAITFNISRLRHCLSYKAVDGDKEVPLDSEHSIYQLLQRPNPLMTEMQFWQAIILNLLFPVETTNLTARDGAVLHGGMNQTGGTCFIIPWIGNEDRAADLSKGEMPTELLPMGSRFFEPMSEKNSRGLHDITGWRYKVPEQGATPIEFKHSEIIRIYMFNPYAWIAGMSPFFAAQTAVDQDARSDIFNTRFFQNDAQVSGVLSTKEQMTPEQARDIRHEWEQTYGGIGNQHKTAVIWGGMEYNAISLSHQDMQWEAQKKQNLEQLLGVFGLNKIAIGKYEDLNFATIEAGRKMLWHDTYIPIDEMIWDAFNNQWFRNIEKGVRGYSDYSKIPALSKDIKPMAEAAAIMVKDIGLPPAIACEKVGIDLSQELLDKYPHLLEERKPTPVLSPYGSPMTPEEVKRAANGPIVRGGKDLSKQQRDERAGGYVKAVLDAGEKSFLTMLNRFFYSQRNRTLDKVDAWAKMHTKAVITKSEYVDPRVFLLDQDAEFDAMLKMYYPAVERQLRLEQTALKHELGTMISWDVTDSYVQGAVDKRADLLDGINTKTFSVARDGVASAIKEATDAGLTPQETAKLIKRNVTALYEVRTGAAPDAHGEFDLGGLSSSTTIARTEMGSVASIARFDAYRAEGVNRHQWTTAEDDRVRDTHAAVDGMTVKLGDIFGITGLRYPRDPMGDPSSTINCRCSVFAYWTE